MEKSTDLCDFSTETFPIIKWTFLDDGLTSEDIQRFRKVYIYHLKGLHFVTNMNEKFTVFENLVRFFWNGITCIGSISDRKVDNELCISRKLLEKLSKNRGVQRFIKTVERKFYEDITTRLIQNVLVGITGVLSDKCKSFLENTEKVVTTALAGYPERIIQLKVSEARIFHGKLQRRLLLNRMSVSARTILQDLSQVQKMNTINFRIP